MSYPARRSSVRQRWGKRLDRSITTVYDKLPSLEDIREYHPAAGDNGLRSSINPSKPRMPISCSIRGS